MNCALFFQLYIKETSAFFRWTVKEEIHAINGPLHEWRGMAYIIGP